MAKIGCRELQNELSTGGIVLVVQLLYCARLRFGHALYTHLSTSEIAERLIITREQHNILLELLMLAWIGERCRCCPGMSAVLGYHDLRLDVALRFRCGAFTDRA